MMQTKCQLAEEYARGLVPNPDCNEAPYYTTLDKWWDFHEAFVAGYDAALQYSIDDPLKFICNMALRSLNKEQFEELKKWCNSYKNDNNE